MLSFKGYITEMAQQGFVYEVNAAKALKAHDIVPKGFTVMFRFASVRTL